MIERNVSGSHLDAIEAQLRLALLQVESFRQHLGRLEAQAVPKVTVELPERCAGVHETRCAMQSEDAKAKNLAGSWFCKGCRQSSEDAT